MKISEIVDISRLHAALEQFRRVTGVPIEIHETGEECTGSAISRDLCVKFLRVNPTALQRCREREEYFRSGMAGTAPVRYRCRHGLWEWATPIRCEDTHVATLTLGQFFFADDKPRMEFFQELAREYGFDPARFQGFVNEVPVFDRRVVSEAMDSAALFVRHLFELGMKNRHLEREVQERRAAEDVLRKSRAGAEVSNLMKSRFLSLLNRELRTPMDGVVGVSELLLDTVLTLEQRDLVETLKSGSDALVIVADEVLDFSLMENGRLELEPIEFNLRELTDDLGEMIAQRAQDKGLEYVSFVAPEVPELVRGDARRIRQVLVHLLRNAVKFTPVGEVVLKVTVGDPEQGRMQVRFTITDTGIGIPPDRLDGIFQSIPEPADVRNDGNVGGAGLGLALSRRLVELLGGGMGVSSLSGKGSTFWFQIPLHSVSHGDSPVGGGGGGEHLAAALQGRPVLIVDDHPLNRSLLRQQFREWDLACDEAGDGPSALRKMRRIASRGKPFGLALIDQYMPEMSGEALVDEISRDRSLKDIPVVFMTPFAKRGDVVIQIGTRVAALLAKPIRREHLRKCLEKALGCQAEEMGAESRARRSGCAEEGRRRFKVLLAEDNPLSRKILLKTMDRLGYQALAVENGKQVLEILGRESCDLILLDLQMPEMNGFEAAGEIRRLENGNGRVPIIALTAYAFDQEREKSFQAGMDDFLIKPVPAMILAKVLERHLGSKSPNRPAGTLGPEKDAGESILPESAEAVFHRRRLLERLAGDERRLHEWVREFIAGFPAGAETMREAWLQRRFDEALQQAQSLRVEASDLEASRLKERLQILESRFGEDETEGVQELFDLLETDFMEFRVVVGECGATPESGES